MLNEGGMHVEQDCASPAGATQCVFTSGLLCKLGHRSTRLQAIYSTRKAAKAWLAGE